MADTLQQLLRERVADDGPAVKYGDRVWSWREHLAGASAVAATLIGIADRQRPLHVGALLGNTPEMLTATAAAALGGYVLCGINDTRRGEALARDIVRADCQILLTDAAHRGLLDGLSCPEYGSSTRRAAIGRSCSQRPGRLPRNARSRPPTPS